MASEYEEMRLTVKFSDAANQMLQGLHATHKNILDDDSDMVRCSANGATHRQAARRVLAD